MPDMAWANTLLDCSFRGVVFDVVGIKDSMGNAVSVAERPYVDGGNIEDLGARPTRFSLQAVFFGDDYEDRLFAALDALNTPGCGELIHPVYGVIKSAKCVTREVSHSATEVDSCTVSMEFIEDGDPISFFEEAGAEQVQANVGSRGDSALDAIASRLADIVTAIKESAPLAALTDLRESMVGPLLGFVAQVQGVAISGLDVLDEPRAWARDVAALSNGVIATASFGDNLMGDWRAVTGVFNRLGATYGFGSGAASGGGSGVSPVAPGATPMEAQGMALVNVYLSVNNATAQADAAAAVLAAEATAPTLSPDEIELVIDSARTEIDAAISLARAALVLEQSRDIVEPLKDLALVLLQIGKAIIELRPPLVMRTLTGIGNLRLVAHLLYGDHTRAVELLRLNALANPNALQKGDMLRAYAR